MTGLARNDYACLLQLKLIRYLEQHWDEPDEGIWEVRGPRRHFVHSKVMAWVAVDRTIKLIESGDADGPLDKWRELRDDIHRDVCEKGYDKERNTFTQSYGSQGAGRVPAAHPADGLPAAGRQAGDRHHRGDPARAVHPGRLHPALPDLGRRRGRGRPARATRARSWPARSGWRTTSR